MFKSNLSSKAFLASKSAYTEEYLSQLRAEYNELKDMPIEPLTDELFMEYKKSGNRLLYENKYFKRRKMLRDFAITAWLGDGSAIAHLERIMTEVCNEKSWALPAHTDSADTLTIDLFAAETAQTLTEIISLVPIRKDLCKRCIDEVKKRVLTPFINRIKPYNWELMNSNWCAVCGGCIGMTAVYLIEDDRELEKVVGSLKSTFDRYIRSFAEDGACLEGLYYWNYGMMYFTSFLDLYRQRTGSDFRCSTEKMKRIADFPSKCCIGNGFTVSFSDGYERDRIYAGLMAKLSEMYSAEPVSIEYLAGFSGDECGRWCKAVRDISWYKNIGESKYKSEILSCAQWAVLKNGKCSAVIKGGTNGEPHNHNDIGSFAVLKNGVMTICDLGAGEYTADYFSEKRYEIFCNSSFGHSVPVINGKGQQAGEKFCAKDFRADSFSASMDIGGAYNIDALAKLTRTIICGENLELCDKFNTNGKLRVTERFITRCEAVIDGNAVRLISDGKTAGTLFAENSYDISISTYIHRGHSGQEVKVRSVDFSFDVNNEHIFAVKLI